jgi:DNA-binding IclR family transcriptional regulator
MHEQFAYDLILSYNERMEKPPTTPTGTAAIDRTLALFENLVLEGGTRSLGVIAEELALPSSTAHRMAALLVRRGLIAPVGRGYYVAGLALSELAALSDPHKILETTARPLLRRLARQTGATAHLGVWDGDMVTYLVKESGCRDTLFTREGGQLEAYCSAIGKVLLANLAPDRQDAYLAAGPFVALTDRTVVEPERIEAMLRQVAAQGYAVDQQEIADDLDCIALPIHGVRGQVVAAVSLSQLGATKMFLAPPLPLRLCAVKISARLGAPARESANAIPS